MQEGLVGLLLLLENFLLGNARGGHGKNGADADGVDQQVKVQGLGGLWRDAQVGGDLGGVSRA